MLFGTYMQVKNDNGVWKPEGAFRRLVSTVFQTFPCLEASSAPGLFEVTPASLSSVPRLCLQRLQPVTAQGVRGREKQRLNSLNSELFGRAFAPLQARQRRAVEGVLREPAEHPQLPQPARPGRPAREAPGRVPQVVREGGEVPSEQTRRAAHRKQTLAEVSGSCAPSTRTGVVLM